MKYLDEYRDPKIARALVERIKSTAKRTWTIMELCGGQTHSIMKFGLDAALEGVVDLVHGPGCPVCVTPAPAIDRAIAIARAPGTIVCSFGDMLRVPGSSENLFNARADGGDVRVVYSPLDAVETARKSPNREVVFFAVGFETTAPAAAAAIIEADRLALDNFSLIVSHVRVPPAIEAILDAPGNRVQAFLAAGHVCTVTGEGEYQPIVAQRHIPIVITGFEPVDLLEGIARCVDQLEKRESRLDNQYARSVRPKGNPAALAAIDLVFETVDYDWRGIGLIPRSGMRIRPAFRRFDALDRFPTTSAECSTESSSPCRSGEVLSGRIKPHECEAFGLTCTPDHPLGAPMVSGEGACAAHYRYRRVNNKGSLLCSTK